MSSQTEYFHRFIRFKNVDPDRQVILENAVERYLVDLEKLQENDGHRNHRQRRSMNNYTERIIYNTLQEDTTVQNPMVGKKSFTFLMIVERKQSL